MPGRARLPNFADVCKIQINQSPRWSERALSGGETFRLQVNYGEELRPEDTKVYALYVAKE